MNDQKLDTLEPSPASEQADNTDRNGLWAILTVLLVAALSIASLVFMQSLEAKVYPNDFTAFFETDSILNERPLSAGQHDIVENSIELLSNEAEINGVSVTLRAAYGNAFRSTFLLDITLPDGMNAEAVSFQDVKSNYNDPKIAFEGAGCGSESHQTPEDTKFTTQVTIRKNPIPSYTYPSNNGAVRTLDLETMIVTEKDTGKETELIGPWSFAFRYCQDSNWVELIRDPVKLVARGNHGDYALESSESSFTLQLTSVALTEMSMKISYQVDNVMYTDQSEDKKTQSESPTLFAIAILKDGTAIPMATGSGSSSLSEGAVTSGNRDFELLTPAPFSELAFVVINGTLVLKLPVSG